VPQRDLLVYPLDLNAPVSATDFGSLKNGFVLTGVGGLDWTRLEETVSSRSRAQLIDEGRRLELQLLARLKAGTKRLACRSVAAARHKFWAAKDLLIWPRFRPICIIQTALRAPTHLSVFVRSLSPSGRTVGCRPPPCFSHCSQGKMATVRRHGASPERPTGRTWRAQRKHLSRM